VRPHPASGISGVNQQKHTRLTRRQMRADTSGHCVQPSDPWIAFDLRPRGCAAAFHRGYLMNKSKRYRECRFSADVLGEAIAAWQKLCSDKEDAAKATRLHVEHDDDTQWDYEELDEFNADYRKYSSSARLPINLPTLTSLFSLRSGKRASRSARLRALKLNLSLRYLKGHAKRRRCRRNT